jgi:hypothetical protein
MSTRGTRRAVLLASALWAVAILAPRPARGEPAKTPGEAARRDANEMLFAFLRGDFETYLIYAHPKLIEKWGGKEKFIATLQKGYKMMRTDGHHPVKATAGAPIQIVKAGDELHAVLPTMEISNVPAKHGELQMPGHLVGVSRDGGKTWKFFNATALSKADVRQFLPNYNDKLKLPARKAPVSVTK